MLKSMSAHIGHCGPKPGWGLKNIFKFVEQSLLRFHENKSNDNKGISKHLRFCWQQLFGSLCNITIPLKSTRPNKTEIKIIADEMFDKCLYTGSNLQLAPPCDHCSNALPTELPPLLRTYLWNFLNYRKQIKYCGNSIEIFPFWFLKIMIMMWCSFKSQHENNFTPAHLNK